MIGFLGGILGGLVRLLIGVLPLSPFQGITLGEGFDTAIGWLNWVVPVNDMLGIFTLWLAAALAAGVVSFIVRKATGVIGVASGGE